MKVDSINQSTTGAAPSVTAAEARFFAACEAYHRAFGMQPFHAYGVPLEMLTGYLERAVVTGVAEFDPHDWLPRDALA